MAWLGPARPDPGVLDKLQGGQAVQTDGAFTSIGAEEIYGWLVHANGRIEGQGGRTGGAGRGTSRSGSRGPLGQMHVKSYTNGPGRAGDSQYK